MKEYLKPMAEFIDFDIKTLITTGVGGNFASGDLGVEEGGELD